MLSAAVVERIATNLAKISLDPVTYFAVVGAVAGALMDATVSVGNGAIPPTPKSTRTRKARGRRGKARHHNGAATPRAATPGQAANGSPTRPAGVRHAIHFLRGPLGRGPQLVSHVEELAARKGIDAADLEAARDRLGIRVGARTDGSGVVFLLPSQAANAEAAGGHESAMARS